MQSLTQATGSPCGVPLRFLSLQLCPPPPSPGPIDCPPPWLPFQVTPSQSFNCQPNLPMSAFLLRLLPLKSGCWVLPLFLGRGVRLLQLSRCLVVCFDSCFTEPGSLFRRSVHASARGMSLQPLVTFSSTTVLCHLLNSVFLSPSNLPSFPSFLFKFFYPVLVPFFRIWSHFATLYRLCQMLNFHQSRLSKAMLSLSLSLPTC